eukprot:scaffold10794_cov119-Isochrysis_galbana.AAC.4
MSAPSGIPQEGEAKASSEIRDSRGWETTLRPSQITHSNKIGRPAARCWHATELMSNEFIRCACPAISSPKSNVE